MNDPPIIFCVDDREEDLENMSKYLINEIEGTPNVEYVCSTEVLECRGNGRLESVVCLDRESGQNVEHKARAVFLLIGVGPRTDWLPREVARDADGFIYTGEKVPEDCGIEIDRPRYPFETSLPGVFAVGDVRHGSIKRVASAVGEGSIVVPQLHRFLSSS